MVGDTPPDRGLRASRASQDAASDTLRAASEDISDRETIPGERDAAVPRPPGIPLEERYEDLRLLGSGGFGEVRRVRDKRLDRIVAMKLLRPDAGDGPRVRRRFLAEVKLTAGLHHPGIIAIHDYGELDDGRLWFTMPEVRGRTLRAVIDETFGKDGVAPRDPHVQRRRLLDLFARVCDAVAYAHSRGVIHRDLKPENVMVGEFGQVMVMDWGIARRVGTGDDPDEPRLPVTDEPSFDGLTRHGDVMGTPAYMAPEQALGDIGRHGPPTDVYALGAILFHLLSGQPPFGGGDARKAWIQVMRGSAPPLGDGEAPAELSAICARAMAREPADRYAHAGELAAEIEAFLSGARRRERALELLGEALARGPAIAADRARAERLRAEAKVLLSPRKPSDAVALKLPGWRIEDEAESLEREAALGETRWIEGVHGALALDPELPEAHAALADHYSEKLAEAERARRHAEAARYEVLLRAHDRGRHAAFLGGQGVLTLVTDPPGARVVLERYVISERRLRPEPLGEIGPTPLLDVPLEKGSYRLRISAPGRIEVAYPVLIERGERWNGCPPGRSAPYPVPLPWVGELGDDEVYVPAGYCWTGGDPDAPDSLPARRVWIDGFIVGKNPVTNAAYLDFLNDLVATGREAEAVAACPRGSRGGVAGADEQLAFDRAPDGSFRLSDRAGGDARRLRAPAVLMTWRGAAAYARWLAARTRLPYRLLNELEREKAVRGADGRLHPWGDFFDPTWACMLSSHAGEPSWVDVDAYPLDESPYGMRGGAGNVHDYCGNLWTQDGPAIERGRLIVEPEPPEGDGHRSVRGGGWSSVANHCRAAARFALRPHRPRGATGLRVGRSYP